MWGQLGSEIHHSDIALPFFHLRGDGFWHFKAKPDYESILSSKVRLRTIKALQEAVQYAYVDDELFEILRDSTARNSLVSALTKSWFSGKTQQIEQLLRINSFQEFQNSLQNKGGAVYRPEDLQDEAQVVVRNAAFRRIVISIYDYRCAFCGLQILTSLSQSIVDGAHIKPFSRFYDDRIDNGLSLCKNHHWAFDRGWFSISDDYTLMVSDALTEQSPHGTPMKEFQGQRIQLPTWETYYPRSEALSWHRENVFLTNTLWEQRQVLYGSDGI
jgi:putative restriction endonuclease